MKVDGKDIRPIWFDSSEGVVKIIDQRVLPYELKIVALKNVDEIIKAIKEMYVRGAPLIGVTGAYGAFLAACNLGEENINDESLINECKRIKDSRPTAINLPWAVDRVCSQILKGKTAAERIEIAKIEAEKIADFEVDNCKRIGEHGLSLLEKISLNKKGSTVNILTHCNAGWLACIEYGTATAPMYAAYDKGIDIHVWVDETRPLNQGARLTAWELSKYGVKNTIIPDNTGGHLMQHGMVDIVIVGSDRTTYTGDVANKIGTYLKALAAHDNNIPFYVALPSTSFDWTIRNGLSDIPIEKRNPDEVRYIKGFHNGKVEDILITNQSYNALNFAFDVTPSRLVTGFITERGVCNANEESLKFMFPENTKN
ncbi:MAG: S-methyl-5-thioribose-1-phosphate isomerase [Desulfobacterales bacterium]|nr:S-methyl-5-thioribose-1-phosphate isomerase [Desulfobacterales bacterium]